VPLTPPEALPYFENAIYLPMVIIILERDRAEIEIGSFKFKNPYLKVIEQAEKLAQEDLKITNNYLRKNNMKLNKKGNDGTFTEYVFCNKGYEDPRRYLNVRLRNRTEELISVYFAKTGKKDSDLNAPDIRGATE